MNDRGSILIVDDDQALSAAIADALKQHGYDVEIATRGRAGLDRLAKRPIDAVIVDVGLPDISGIDLLTAIKARSAATEVLVISGRATLSVAIEASHGVAFAYVAKPFGREQLVATLEKALERKRLLQALQESEAALRALIDASPLAIVALDRSGNVKVWSETAARMFGWSGDEVIGRPLPTIPEDKADEFADALARNRRGEATSYETQRKRKDGTRLDVITSAAGVLDAEGRLTGTMSVIGDIRERKHLEAQLRQSQKMEAVGQLAAGVAHDFNNLLTVITGRVHLLLQRTGLPPGGADRRDAELIADTAGRAAMLTHQLLAFSRKQPLRATVLDLGVVVAHIVPMLRRLIGEEVELVTPTASESWLVKADANQMEQVILNLAVNARDAMPQGGRLTVQTASVPGRQLGGRLPEIEPGRDYVVLSVADTGVGMDAETRARLFEPFFTTKEAGKGTGLGLAVVHGIVRQHDGVVHVDSEPGRGTTFSIYLPKTDEITATPVSTPTVVRPVTGHETVLLVEDDEQVRVLAREILATNGYTVLEAAHGADALQIFGQHGGPIDLLITDVVMFGISGPQVARRVVSRRPGIKVLYLSGYTADALGRHGVLEPDVMVLRKPFTPEALLQAVRQALEAR
jgi:two-component system, cell cycle sensor histidine kinase and response regulator CckA